jgi:hypothetical protein
LGKEELAMAKMTVDSPSMPGKKVLLLSELAWVLVGRAGQMERLAAAAIDGDFDGACAILREVAGEPGTDGLWLVREKGKRKPRWRALRSEAVALLVAAGIPNIWEWPCNAA